MQFETLFRAAIVMLCCLVAVMMVYGLGEAYFGSNSVLQDEQFWLSECRPYIHSVESQVPVNCLQGILNDQYGIND